MGIETVSLIIAAFANGAIGCAAWMRNFRSRLCATFGTLTALLFLHDTLSVFESFHGGCGAVPRLHLTVVSLLGPSALAALREIVPSERRVIDRWLLAYLPPLLLVAFGMTLGAYVRWQGWLLIGAHAALLFPGALWIVSLARAQERTRLTRERLRLRYAFWGGWLTLATFLTDALAFAGYSLPPLGTLARTLYLIFVFQTFIQKELMTDEEVVAKVALFGGLAVTLSAIYTLLVSWVGNQRDLFYFNSLIASFVILILFDPLRKLSTRWTRRIFLRRNSLLEEELNRLSTELMGIVESSELARRVSHGLQRSLGAERAALYLLTGDALSYVPVCGEASAASGSAGAVPTEISSSNALVEYMSLRRGRPFVLETVENDRDSFRAPQSRRFCEKCLEMLKQLGADFVLPFEQGNRLIGFASVKTGERVALSNEQLRLFVPLSRQIALLVKNAQALSSLRDRDKLATIGEMAAGLAHEIKNPLGAIHGAAQLLREKNAGPEAEFLGIILEETRRLSNVVSDFLEFARPRRADQLSTSCDPLRVVEHTANMVLRDSAVRFEIASEGGAFSLEADPEILKQILLNLFLNAVQAMENTSEPRLQIALRELRQRRTFSAAERLPLHKILEGWDVLTGNTPAYLEIAIRDNGLGIPEEDVPRIFEPFYTTKAKGTGLGLAISRRLVEELGGTISVRTGQEAGCTFILHLPVRRETAKTMVSTAVPRAIP